LEQEAAIETAAAKLEGRDAAITELKWRSGGHIAGAPQPVVQPTSDTTEADKEFFEKRLPQEIIDKIFGGPNPATKKPEDEQK
jgi:hypothetical protein